MIENHEFADCIALLRIRSVFLLLELFDSTRFLQSLVLEIEKYLTALFQTVIYKSDKVLQKPYSRNV